MKKILVLHTGGTIAMSHDAANGTKPGESNPLMQEHNLSTSEYTVESREVFNLPSPHVTPHEMLKLAKIILEAEQQGVSGVVITHGTDTLEETAYFLDLVLPVKIPVVLTGAMRSSNEIGSDGLYNLECSIKTAAASDAVNKGVLVVMNDEIHTARFVTKTHTTNVATFRTPTFGPIGIMQNDGPHFFQELSGHKVEPIEEVTDNVYLLKAYSGMDGLLLDALDNSETKGLVIEGTGAGNLPPKALPALTRLLDNGIPVVLVSRCFNGVAEPVYGYEGGGRELEKMGVIFCQGLNGQKARIKLIVGLSASLGATELKQYMANAIS